MAILDSLSFLRPNVVESVRRRIEQVLNRQSDYGNGFTNVADSFALHYGIEDIRNLYLKSPENLTALCEIVRSAIDRWEPSFRVQRIEYELKNRPQWHSFLKLVGTINGRTAATTFYAIIRTAVRFDVTTEKQFPHYMQNRGLL